MRWRHFTEPNSDRCPEVFCYFWSEQGIKEASGFYESFNDANEKLNVVRESSCTCPFDVCRRLNASSDKDWFEPVEPLHDRCLLPHFYFMDRQKLLDEDRIKYDSYFHESRFRQVKVALKLEDNFFEYRRGKFRNSCISTTARFVGQDIEEDWSVVLEITSEPSLEGELECCLRFLVVEAPQELLYKGNKFVVDDIKRYAEGVVIEVC